MVRSVFLKLKLLKTVIQIVRELEEDEEIILDNGGRTLLFNKKVHFPESSKGFSVILRSVAVSVQDRDNASAKGVEEASRKPLNFIR